MTMMRLTGVAGVLVMMTACAPAAPVHDVTIERSDAPSLFVRVVGNGPDTVLVAHGGGLHHGYLRAPLAPLERGRTLIFYDQRGRGRSEVVTDSTRLTLEDELADFEAVRAHFGLERFKAIGHHWGTVVASLYAADHPDRIERLLLLSPFPAIYSFVYDFVSVVGDSAKYEELLTDAGRPLDVGSVQTVCPSIWPLFFAPLRTDLGTPYRDLAPAVCDAPADRLVHSQFITRNVQRSLGQWVFRPKLNAVPAPTLVIEGGGDPKVEQAATRWAQHLIDARVLLLRRPYLFPWVGEPAAFRQSITAFMNGAWPDRSVEPPDWSPTAAAAPAPPA